MIGTAELDPSSARPWVGLLDLRVAFPIASLGNVSTFVALPRPKCAARGWLISRTCQKVFPQMVARTRILAPIAERLATVPTHLTSSQALLFPLLTTNKSR